MTTPDNPPAVSEAAARWAVDMVCSPDPQKALARFRQQVSDAAKLILPWARDFIGNTEADGERAAALLAPFILPEPVDQLLIEAREIAKAALDPSSHSKCRCPDEIDRGEWDDKRTVKAALNGLRRGMELEREQGA